MTTRTFTFTVEAPVTGFPSWYPSVGAVATIPGSTTIGTSVRAAGGNSYPGTDPDDIVEPWSGGALVYLSGQPYLLVYGGGHGDSAYNGIHKFGPLYGSGSNTPEWSLHLAASAVGSITVGGPNVRTYLDGRQPSNHTYNALVGVSDALYAANTGTYPVDGNNAFFRLTAAGQTTLANEICAGDFHCAAHYAGKIYAIGGNTVWDRLRIYDIASNTWTSEPNADIALGNYVRMAVDTQRGAILVNGQSITANGAGSYWPNVASLGTRRNSISAAPSSGSGAYSLEYDADRDVFVSYVSNSLTLYEASAATLAAGGDAVWVARTFTGTTPAASPVQGTYGRFRYVPELKGYVVVPNLETSVYFFRAT